MYGKLFASTFTGSMMGKGPHVIAVWSYVIANTVASQVELNPPLLATMIGCPVEHIEAAIDLLCAPDPKSRSLDDNGRRLIREGQFAYKVVNHAKYNAMRNEGDRREYNRLKQREHRERLRAVPSEPRLAHSADNRAPRPSKRDIEAANKLADLMTGAGIVKTGTGEK